MTATNAETPGYEEVLGSHPNKMIRDMWKVVQEESAPLAAMQQKVIDASPPPVSELDKRLAESEDPALVEMREAIKRAEESLRVAREDAHKHLLKGYQTLSEDEIKKLQADYAAQATRARKAVGMLRDSAELVIKSPELVKTIDQYRIPNLRGVASGTRGTANLGEGGPRPKVDKIVITRADGKSKEDTRISTIAAWAKLTSEQIREAWFAKAGVSQWQDVKDVQEFKVGDCNVIIHPFTEE